MAKIRKRIKEFRCWAWQEYGMDVRTLEIPERYRLYNEWRKVKG